RTSQDSVRVCDCGWPKSASPLTSPESRRACGGFAVTRRESASMRVPADPASAANAAPARSNLSWGWDLVCVLKSDPVIRAELLRRGSPIDCEQVDEPSNYRTMRYCTIPLAIWPSGVVPLTSML